MAHEDIAHIEATSVYDAIVNLERDVNTLQTEGLGTTTPMGQILESDGPVLLANAVANAGIRDLDLSGHDLSTAYGRTAAFLK